jgi:hypothetical protein
MGLMDGASDEQIAANTRALRDNTEEIRALRGDLAEFGEQAKAIMAAVQGMGGAGALVNALGPLKGILGSLGRRGQ